MARAAIEESFAGERSLPGLAAPVAIGFDGFGIPEVRAGGEADAWQALGFLHAACRPFSLELSRRTWSGRLSAMFSDLRISWPLEPVRFKGRALRELDIYLRTLDLVDSAARQAERLGTDRPLLEAYARGVDAGYAFLAERGGFEEARLLGVEPEPWTPADSCLVYLGYAFALAEGPGEAIANLQLLRHLPPDDPRRPSLLPAAADLAAVADCLAALDRATRAFVGLEQPGKGSNACVVPPERSASGAPLLACDLHQGPGLPVGFFLAALVTPERALRGFTLPGLPGLWCGSNGRLAWGMTRAAVSEMQLCVERFAEDDPGRVAWGMEVPEAAAAEPDADADAIGSGSISDTETEPESEPERDNAEAQSSAEDRREGGLEDRPSPGHGRGHAPQSASESASASAPAPTVPLRTIDEKLEVRGQPDDGFRRRIGPNGPILSDLGSDGLPAGFGLSLRWTGYAAACPLRGLLALNRARSEAEVEEAATRLDVPALEIAWAATDGSWGTARSGRVLRPLAALPVDGREPFRCPRVPRPERAAGPAVLANAALEDAEGPLSLYPSPGYRARRLTALLEVPTLDADALCEAQCDTVSLFARELLEDFLRPWLERVRPRLREELREELEKLCAWDGDCAPKSEPATLFHRLVAALVQTLLGEDGRLREYVESRAWRWRRLLFEALAPTSPWLEARGRDHRLLAAFEQALAEVSGQDLEAIEGEQKLPAGAWGRLHRLELRHSIDPRGRTWQVPAMPLGGSWFTLNPGDTELGSLDEPRLIACARFVIDLAAPARARFALAGGQLADPRSSHLCDLLHHWRLGRWVRLDPARPLLRSMRLTP